LEGCVVSDSAVIALKLAARWKDYRKDHHGRMVDVISQVAEKIWEAVPGAKVAEVDRLDVIRGAILELVEREMKDHEAAVYRAREAERDNVVRELRNALDGIAVRKPSK
jgi:hypothetical protein